MFVINFQHKCPLSSPFWVAVMPIRSIASIKALTDSVPGWDFGCIGSEIFVVAHFKSLDERVFYPSYLIAFLSSSPMIFVSEYVLVFVVQFF